jgi:predicted nucleotidyltransferase
MDAAPILARIAEVLNRHGLDVVMVGNAAAAIQGAPVTTIDVDFLFRKTPVNVKKLKAVTAELKAVMMRPYYPADDMFRISRDDDTLQIDFLTQVAGLRSFEGLRKRATTVQFGDHRLYVASLADIIKSKKAAGRPKDLAVMHVLENALAQAADHSKDATGSSQERE